MCVWWMVAVHNRYHVYWMQPITVLVTAGSSDRTAICVNETRADDSRSGVGGGREAGGRVDDWR